MRALRLLSLFFFFLNLNSANAKIDSSIDIFFPKSLKHLQYVQTEFPVFWWNFAVIQPSAKGADFEKAQKVCSILKKYQDTKIKRLVCGEDLGGFVETLGEWSKDIVLREKFDKTSAKYKNQIAASFAEFSFLSSEKKDFFALKRLDPLEQWQIYLEKSQALTPAKFERQQGFLIDPPSQKLIIPVQFLIPAKMDSVESIMNELHTLDGVSLVGPHSSAFENEKQIHLDLNVVSYVGALVFGLFILFLVLKGRLGALLLFPPVVLALSLAGGLTQLVFGSIHGLTLAFGSGIVGLAVDYGLHGAINSESRQTWKSNSIGFLTTAVGLAVLIFSGIPLIRQMMFFALSGIFFGFLFFFILCQYVPQYFTFKGFDLSFPDFKYSWLIILVLIGGGIFGAFKVNLSFDLRRFNYQTFDEAQASNWFYSQGVPQEIFLLIHERNDLPKIADETDWAGSQKIQYVGLGEFLPEQNAQRENAESWALEACPYFKRNLSPPEQKIFKPFLVNICDAKHHILSFEDMQKKDYLNHLMGRQQFVSLFLTKDKKEEESVRKKFPEAKSLIESIRGFSDSLEKDVQWMLPAALLFCTIILFIYYKNFVFVLASYIPFLSGLGLFFLAKLISGEGLDLISVLGLLMVFGFSIDYGVFATDIYAFPQIKNNALNVYSVLTLAALTNVISFFPLLFAKHPILHQLGFSLFFGTIGTYLGTIWGIKRFLELKKRAL